MGGWVRDLEPADQVASKASIATMAGIHGIDITDGKADFLEYDSALGETPLRRHFAVEKAYYEWTCEGAERRFPRLSERSSGWRPIGRLRSSRGSPGATAASAT